MKQTLKFICLAVLALTLSGCGQKALVPENTVVATYVELERFYESGTHFARVIISELPVSSRSQAVKDLEHVLKCIDKYKDSLSPQWAVIALGGSFHDVLRAPYEHIAVAVRIDADETTAKDKLREWVVERTGKEDAEPLTRGDTDIYDVYSLYAGRIADDYLVFATSKESFWNMFNLYTGETKPSKEFKDLSRISGNTVARVATAPVCNLITRFNLAQKVAEFGETCNDADLADLVLNLGAATLDILADGDDFGLSLRVNCGSPSDAKTLEHVFQAAAFISRTGFDVGAYLAENPDLVGGFLLPYKDRIRAARDFLNSATRSVDIAAARDGDTAEMTFATSIRIIAKAFMRNGFSDGETRAAPEPRNSPRRP